MSNFEKLVYSMRKAQKRFEENPSKANEITKLISEEDVDDELDFMLNCKGQSFKEVKYYLENRNNGN